MKRKSERRVTELSDLDLCFKETIPAEILIAIEEDFENSNLPFKVEILDYNSFSNEFKNLINSELRVIQMVKK